MKPRKIDIVRVPLKDCETGNHDHIRQVAGIRPGDVVERIYFDYETGEHVLRVIRNGEEDE